MLLCSNLFFLSPGLFGNTQGLTFRKSKFSSYLFSKLLMLAALKVATSLGAQHSLGQTSFEDVKQLLLQSAQSIKTTNYQGYFTYQHGSVLDSVEVIHRYKDGREFETVKHLNGKPREFSRFSNRACAGEPAPGLVRSRLPLLAFCRSSIRQGRWCSSNVADVRMDVFSLSNETSQAPFKPRTIGYAYLKACL